jgi:hypothetical protein
MAPTTIGLSDNAHRALQMFKEEKIFNEMVDGYRFAIALALSKSVSPPEVPVTQTIFNIGTLDPDRTLYLVVSSLYPDTEIPTYRIVERLAEWGVNYMMDIYTDKGDITFSDFFKD